MGDLPGHIYPGAGYVLWGLIWLSWLLRQGGNARVHPWDTKADAGLAAAPAATAPWESWLKIIFPLVEIAGELRWVTWPMTDASAGVFQHIAAEDVALIVAEMALAAPANGIVEIAGPDRAPFNEMVARYLKAIGDPRQVVKDPEARYFGGRVEERSLVPLGEARLGRIRFDEWIHRPQAKA